MLANEYDFFWVFFVVFQGFFVCFLCVCVLWLDFYVDSLLLGIELGLGFVIDTIILST